MKIVTILVLFLSLTPFLYAQDIYPDLVSYARVHHSSTVIKTDVLIGLFNDDRFHDLAITAYNEDGIDLCLYTRLEDNYFDNYFFDRFLLHILSNAPLHQYVNPIKNNLYTNQFEQLYFIQDQKYSCIKYDPSIKEAWTINRFYKKNWSLPIPQEEKITSFVYGKYYYKNNAQSIVYSTQIEDASKLHICHRDNLIRDEILPFYTIDVPTIVSELYSIKLPDNSNALFFQSVEGWHILKTEPQNENFVHLDINNSQYSFLMHPPEDVIKPIDIITMGDTLLVSVETAEHSDIAYLSFNLSEPNPFAEHKIITVSDKSNHSNITHLAKYAEDRVIMIIGDKTIEAAKTNNKYMIYSLLDSSTFTFLQEFTPVSNDTFDQILLSEFIGLGYVDEDEDLDYIFSGQLNFNDPDSYPLRHAVSIFSGKYNPDIPPYQTSISDFTIYE